MRKIRFAEGEFYHIYNRGVEKREVFSTRNDYERFLYLLFACNDVKPLLNSQHHYRGLASIGYGGKRDVLVDILCFCVMPNHFHMLLTPRAENGISAFMQKVGTGYTMYFNTKRKRSGSLFQGTFKAIHIDEEKYLTHLSRYIHINPAELREPEWKESGIRDWKDTYDFVREYPWSSYADYLGQKRFHRIINTKLILKICGTPKQYERFVKEWVTRYPELPEFPAKLTIEA